MSKKIYLCLMTVLFAAVMTPAVYADDVQVHVDGQVADVSAVIVNERTLVPARYIAEMLGNEVVWLPETRQVDIGEGFILLTIDSTEVYLGGETVTLDVAPQIIGESTFVPLRFIAEAFGVGVGFFEGIVHITTAQNPFIGIWNLDDSDGWRTIFRVDGTGADSHLGIVVDNFVWHIDEARLVIQHIERPLVEVWEYSFEGSQVVLTDVADELIFAVLLPVYDIGDHRLVGAWAMEMYNSYIYVFHEDGTGDRGVTDILLETFDWWAYDGILHLRLHDFDEEYLRNQQWYYGFDDEGLYMLSASSPSGLTVYFIPVTSTSIGLVGVFSWNEDFDWVIVLNADQTGSRGFHGFNEDYFVWWTQGNTLFIDVYDPGGALPYAGAVEEWTFTLVGRTLGLIHNHIPGWAWMYYRISILDFYLDELLGELGGMPA